jgi:hypothetical protein
LILANRETRQNQAERNGEKQNRLECHMEHFQKTALSVNQL